MRTTYPFQLINGHIVASIEGGLALIDTGSQLTLSTNREVRFLGQAHPAARFPFEIDPVRTLVGAEIDTIIGTDALASAPFLVDWQGEQLVFGAACSEGRRVRLDNYLGIPCATCRIGETTGRMIVDTGATFALVREHLVSGPAVARWRDYSPLIGFYETTLHDVTIRCGDQALDGLTGMLPEALARLLPGVDGVIGTHMLRKAPVQFDLAGRALTFMSATADVLRGPNLPTVGGGDDHAECAL